MQDRQSAFPNLTADAGNEVLNRVADNQIFPCLQVNKNWAIFFSNKMKLFIPDMISEFIPSVCKEKTLAEIKPKIDWILRNATEEQKKALYLNLKLLEEEIIDITANTLFRHSDHKQLKINHEKFNQYLIEIFGIAGLINTWTFKRMFGYNGSEDKAKAFAGLVALQSVLHTQEEFAHLEWISAHLTNSKCTMYLEFIESELHITSDSGRSLSINNMQQELVQSGEFRMGDYEAGIVEYEKVLTLVGYEFPKEKNRLS